MIEIKGLIWDEWNVEYIARYDVRPEEVERVLEGRNVKYLTTYKNRLMVLGRSKNRLLSIVLAKEEKSKFYVVTARDMDKKERRIYRGES